MDVSINHTPWIKTLVGRSYRHDPAKSYGDEIRAGLGPVWEAVRGSQAATTGINHVVYGENGEIFCCVELKEEPRPVPGLEMRRIELPQYGYYHLTGPYDRIPAAYDAIKAEFSRRGLRQVAPGIEIYGHWNDDPQKLETEILLSFARE